MAREVTIMTPEQVELTFELAGIGSRAIAMIIDVLILTGADIVLFIALIGAGFMTADFGIGRASMWVLAIVIVIFFAINGGYFLFFEATRNGQTPGKKIARIRVIRDTGHPVDFRAALLRNVVRIVDYLPSAYGVAIVVVFLSPEYRRVGDYVGGTLVVRVAGEVDTSRQRAAGMAESPVFTPGPAEYSQPIPDGVAFIPPGSLPYIGAIQKDDYRAIRHFLDRRRQLNPIVARNLARQLAQPIAHKLNMDDQSIQDPIGFLEAVSVAWERSAIH